MAEWWESAPLAEEKPPAQGGEWWADAPLADEATATAAPEKRGVMAGFTQALSDSGFLSKIPVIGQSLETMPDNVQENVISAGVNIPRGATAGLIDEVAGIASPDLKEGFRNMESAAREENPIASGVGEIGGAIAGAGIAGGNTLVNETAKKAGALKTGAAAGALYGAGTADDGNRLKGGASGALLGATGTLVAQKVALPIGTAVVNFLKGRGKAATQGAEKEALAVFKKAAEADGFNFEQKMAELAKKGVTDEKMVFEEFGPSVKRLAVAIGSDGGEASSKMITRLTERQIRQKPYVNSRLKKIFKTDDFSTVRTELGNSFTKIGSPMYKELMPKPMEATQEVGSLLTRPGMDKIIKKAAANAARKGEKIEPNTVGFFHNLKLAVDDKVSSKASIGNVQRETSKSWKAISDELVAEIEKQVPDYAAARTFWRGAKADEAALELGQKAFNPSTYAEDIAADFAKMSESEKAFFKAGAFRKARQLINTKGDKADAAGRFKSSNIREQLGAILEPDELQSVTKLFDDVSDQTASFNLVNPERNSATAIRAGSSDALKTGKEKAVSGAAKMILQPRSTLESLVERAATNKAKMSEKTKNELLTLLTENPKLIKEVPKPVLAQLPELSAINGAKTGASTSALSDYVGN